MPKSSENLRKFSEELGNLREFPKISETRQTRFWGTLKNGLKNFGKCLAIFGNFWKNSETVQNGFLKNLRKIFGSVWFFEIFWNLRKRFKSVFQMFLWFFKIFWKSSQIFGSVRKSSEIFRKLSFGNGWKVFFRCFYDLLKFSENLRKSWEVFENRRKISWRDRKCS